MLKFGVLGAGHLGKIHLRLIQESDQMELIGFYDPDPQVSLAVQEEFGYRVFSSAEQLIENVDVVDIVTPTLTHYELAQKAILAQKHVFLEKPITFDVNQAQQLTQLAEKQQVLGMVGHVERFNPAFKAARSSITAPMFIETHRLAEFNPRGTDVPVVLDLMIHDIDIVLSVVNSAVKEISASGVSVISDTPDIANARIVFENGCVANLTSSRISLKNMRKSRFFQKDAYIAVDFLSKQVEIVKMKNAPEKAEDFALILQNAEGIRKQIYFDNPAIKPSNAIREELESFARSIETKETPEVSFKDGAQALRVAQQIIDLF
ncbi:MAG: Gfo/Idh/MocA family protein [Flavobacteriaceae bacterium]